MVRLRCVSLAERVLIPAFLFFFLKLYPPAWIARSTRQTAGAAGGSMLVRRSALERIGGIAAIRGELIDDCALARAIKAHGGIWLGLTSRTFSIRSYSSFAEAGRMISRTAFTQLRHSMWLLAATTLGMTLTYIGPPVLVLGWRSLPAFGSWLLMSIAYWPALRWYKRSLIWAPFLPLIALFYLGATLRSALLYRRGRGGEWKDRMQALPDA